MLERVEWVKVEAEVWREVWWWLVSLGGCSVNPILRPWGEQLATFLRLAIFLRSSGDLLALTSGDLLAIGIFRRDCDRPQLLYLFSPHSTTLYHLLLLLKTFSLKYTLIHFQSLQGLSDSIWRFKNGLSTSSAISLRLSRSSQHLKLWMHSSFLSSFLSSFHSSPNTEIRVGIVDRNLDSSLDRWV